MSGLIENAKYIVERCTQPDALITAVVVGILEWCAFRFIYESRVKEQAAKVGSREDKIQSLQEKIETLVNSEKDLKEKMSALLQEKERLDVMVKESAGQFEKAQSTLAAQARLKPDKKSTLAEVTEKRTVIIGLTDDIKTNEALHRGIFEAARELDALFLHEVLPNPSDEIEELIKLHRVMEDAAFVAIIGRSITSDNGLGHSLLEVACDCAFFMNTPCSLLVYNRGPRMKVPDAPLNSKERIDRLLGPHKRFRKNVKYCKSAVQLCADLRDVIDILSTAESVLTQAVALVNSDVFLCHNSEDKPAVKEIAYRLRKKGIKPWLDEWELPPGLPWQPLLEKQIGGIRSAAVFVGSKGIGPWQQDELDAFLREFKKRNCPVVPVLLRTAPGHVELPIFLQGLTWVDFRKTDPDPLAQLIWGITGRKQ